MNKSLYLSQNGRSYFVKPGAGLVRNELDGTLHYISQGECPVSARALSTQSRSTFTCLWSGLLPALHTAMHADVRNDRFAPHVIIAGETLIC